MEGMSRKKNVTGEMPGRQPKPFDVKKWLRMGLHLPRVLRDFHDQKDLFKAIDEWAGHEDEKAMIKRPDWVAAQCYVIDLFLRYMAIHGYTLQRARHAGELHDLSTTLAAAKKRRDDMFAAALMQGLAKQAPAAPQSGDSA